MYKYAIIMLSVALISSIAYAMNIETNPETLIENKNRETIIECLENVYTQTGSKDMKKQIKKCESIPMLSITWMLATGSTVAPSIEIWKLNDCMAKYNHKKVCTEYAQWLRTNNIKSEIETEELWVLHDKVCKKQINSPLCNDMALFDRLYRITEERLPWKSFYPILLGITNAESSLWLNFAKDRVWGTCAGRNNWWWVKWRKTDTWESVKDQKIPDEFGCYLYKFDSIEDYWISKVNTIRFWYKGCVDSLTPIKCLSYAYVWDRYVPEKSWIKNVSIFLE